MTPPLGQHSKPVQPDNTPTAKVTAFTLAGSAVTMITFMLAELGYELPAGVGAALATWIGFGIAFWKRSRPEELDL